MGKDILKIKQTNTIGHYFLFLYILINVAAAFWMISSNELMGDLQGRPYSNPKIVMLAAFLVTASYFLILLPIFNIMNRMQVKEIKFPRSENFSIDRMGVLIIILQALFLLFNSYYGVNIAGVGNKIDNKIVSYFFIMIDPDYLFLIYYGLYRENKYFYANLTVWCVSNLLRGWNGILIFIIFFELCRLHRTGSLNYRKIFIVILATLLTYPILSSFKWIVRASAFSNADYGTIVDLTINSIQSTNYAMLVWAGIEQAFGRLQVVSLLVEVIENRLNLKNDFFDFRFLPFWLDGLQGIAFDRIFYGTERNSVGVAMAQYINPTFEGVGNTNLSYPGWFFIIPIFSPFYLIYSLGLGFLVMFFVKKIKNDKVSRELIWLVWLMYLLPPWLGAMVKFIYSTMFFLILKILISKIHLLK